MPCSSVVRHIVPNNFKYRVKVDSMYVTHYSPSFRLVKNSLLASQSLYILKHQTL
jgi:hypothetical protein